MKIVTSRFGLSVCALFLAGAILSCTSPQGEPESRGTDNPEMETAMVKDVHSYSNPESVKVTNVDLDWDVLFDEKIIKGTAELSFDRSKKGNPT